MNDYESLAKVPAKKLREAARDAMSAAANAEGVRPSGCGRAYVMLGKVRKNAKAATILREEGFKMFPRPGHSGLCIYVGYDNCTGVPLGKAEAIAKAFRSHGISAGMDADGD